MEEELTQIEEKLAQLRLARDYITAYLAWAESDFSSATPEMIEEEFKFLAWSLHTRSKSWVDGSCAPYPTF